MIATRVGTGVDPLPSDRYCCARCGSVRECTASRPKPKHCSDCTYVLNYKPPEEKPGRTFPTHLTDDECRAGRRAFRAGDRSPEVEEEAREYWRRMDVAKRNRRAAA